MDTDLYLPQMESFVSACMTERPEFLDYYKYPCLRDDTPTTAFDSHYIYHVAWATRKVVAAPPTRQLISLSSLHFCASICGVTPTIFFDFRPAQLQIPNLECLEGDITCDHQWDDKAFPSVSCMHVVEHIGLARYGDELDVNADVKAMHNLKRIVQANGRLLFVVPVGRPAVYFNAHRVYSAQWIHDFFSDRFDTREFYFIPGPSHLPPRLNCSFLETESFEYGCGCFDFIARK